MMDFSREQILNSDGLDNFLESEAGIANGGVESIANRALTLSGDSCSITGSIKSLVNETVQSTVELLEASTEAALSATMEAIQRLSDGATEVFDSVTDGMRNQFISLKEQLEEALPGSDEEQEILDQFNEYATNTVAAIQAGTGALADFIDSANAILDKISDAIDEVIKNVVSAIADLNALICRGVSNVLGNIEGSVTGGIDSLTTAISEGKDPNQAVKDIHSDGLSNATSAASDTINTAVSELEAL